MIRRSPGRDLYPEIARYELAGHAKAKPGKALLDGMDRFRDLG